MEAEKLAREVIAKLRHAGHQAYLVGGCVRDLLLGGKPKDFDVATDARPDRIWSSFPSRAAWARTSGWCWCAICWRRWKWPPSAAITITRRPPPDERPFRDTIRAQDVLRRDFTINGLLMDPDTGEVLDYVEGRADLERRRDSRHRRPGVRFREDHLRLLRAVRFAARLGFAIEPGDIRGDPARSWL